MVLRIWKLATRPLVFLVLACILSAVMTMLCYGTDRGYIRRVLVADIKKKKLPATEETLKHGSLKKLYLYDRYGIRALLAVEKYPEHAVTVYGLFGELPLLHRIVDELGDHKTIPVIAHFYAHERFVCNVRDANKNPLTRLENYLLAASMPVEEVRKIVRATCVLLKLYEEGHDFVNVFQDGTIELRFQGTDFCRNIRSTGGSGSYTKLTAQQLEAIREPALEMARFDGNIMEGIPIYAHATLAQALGWNLLGNSISLVRLTRSLAPAIFSKSTVANTISGFGHLFFHDPGIWPSAIVTWSRATGKMLVVLQYFGLLFMVGIVATIGMSLYWLAKKIHRLCLLLKVIFQRLFSS